MRLNVLAKIGINQHLGFALGLVFVAAPNFRTVSAQEPSVIIKSLDDLEKRILKVEGEVGKLKKSSGGQIAASKNSAAPDSSLPKISARLDSMLVRLNAIESRTGTRMDASPVAAKAAPDSLKAGSNRNDEVASLVLEVREMITFLKTDSKQPDPRKPTSSAAASEKAAGTPNKESASPAPVAAPAGSPTVAPAAVGLEIKGDLQIQGEKKLTSAKKADNLDDFWGRLNFGAEYNQPGFQSKINIRIFPEGFGFEPLTGASFDTTGQGSLKLQTQPSSRVVINHAWARYAVGAYHLRFGRFETLETQSSNYGNYVDLGPGGKFLARPAAHNAVELTRNYGAFSGSVLLGTSDNKLNRGFLRLYEKYTFSKKWNAAIGYRANHFDRFKFEKQEVLHRYDVNVVGGLPQGWKAFAEAGLLQVAGKEDQTPILLGIQPHTGKRVDLLSLETEFLPDRKVAGKSKEWLMNMHVRKIMGRLKVESSLSSNLADSDWNSFNLGVRVTSNIK